NYMGWAPFYGNLYGVATVLAGESFIVSPGHGLVLGDSIRIGVPYNGPQPPGWLPYDLYYVVGLTPDGFTLSTGAGGPPIIASASAQMPWQQVTPLTVLTPTQMTASVGSIHIIGQGTRTPYALVETKAPRPLVGT